MYTVTVLRAFVVGKKSTKIFIKINRNIKLMYLFLKFVNFVETETFGFDGKLIVSGHFF